MKALFTIGAFALAVSIGSAAATAPAPSGTTERDKTADQSQVTLVSDGETWVSITRVRSPEKLQTKVISLPPGEYEVVGRRRGYRDEVKSLRVRSGEKQTLTIICTVSSNSR